MEYDGLEVRNGRLINNRPQSEMGIDMACRLRAKMKGAKLVQQIADGIELSEERKRMQEIFGPIPTDFFKK
ncbi:MAG: hypothetical protein Unbinned1524contig1000_12 [Prokaryotic dsDNA virus sp.]|nr:MAG: hypothetical protein Unbinned1524contig1000_12 [Prokaryotic dsDNA virus sp.]|tara:strand:- start:4821 stop:5033 length:213 start_codon:yes stop_codon:yes gene_type:complete